MNHIKLLVWLFIFSQSTLAQVRHISKAETDRFLLCARSLFQKPVYITVVGPQFDATMMCSSDRQEVLRELGERKIAVFENDAAVLLVPERIRPDIGNRYEQINWHKFDVQIHVSILDDPLPPGSRALRKAEQDQIAKVILNQALLPPLVPGFASVTGDSQEMELAVTLDAHHFSSETESIVAIFGSAGDKRLVYGHLVHGVYRMLWDTPLLGPDVTIRYQDVNGDGIPEIVARWTEAGGSVSYQAMSVFSSQGEDLTTQEECSVSPLAEAAQFACAISGAYVDFERTASGRYDILDLPNTETDPPDAERYTLINGHYSLPIPVLTAVTPVHFSNKMLNGRVALTGRYFIRDSEIRFTQTSGEFPGYDRPREVRVRAEFVSPTELRARVSDVLCCADSAGDWQVRIQNRSGHSESLVLHVDQAAQNLNGPATKKR